MKMSRRKFVAAGATSVPALCVSGATPSKAAATGTQLPDEDGYKLWLRYAPPGDAAKNYRRIVQRIRVDGTSATSGIIRDELRSGIASMLGSSVPTVESGHDDGTLVIGVTGSAATHDMDYGADLSMFGENGFMIRSVRTNTGSFTAIVSKTEIGRFVAGFA